MENLHYDLLKLLHSKLDNVWRLEKHYSGDAVDCADCAALFNKLLEDERNHAEELKAELLKHGLE
jgi:hypothetical protein